jgi:hypothetical protein
VGRTPDDSDGVGVDHGSRKVRIVLCGAAMARFDSPDSFQPRISTGRPTRLGWWPRLGRPVQLGRSVRLERPVPLRRPVALGRRVPLEDPASGRGVAWRGASAPRGRAGRGRAVSAPESPWRSTCERWWEEACLRALPHALDDASAVDLETAEEIGADIAARGWAFARCGEHSREVLVAPFLEEATTGCPPPTPQMICQTRQKMICYRLV